MRILESNLFGKIDMDDLKDFEKSNSITFPSDYREFLIEHNGGVPEPNKIRLQYSSTDVQVLFGMYKGDHYANFFKAVQVFHNRIPSWYIPIGRDSGGNLFIMSLWEENKGVVAFWSHEGEAPEGEADQYFDNLTHIADSFAEFLNNLIPDDNPFE